jgi:hypothetical protein
VLLINLADHKANNHDNQRVIAGFRREVDEKCALLGYYAESSGNPIFIGLDP